MTQPRKTTYQDIPSTAASTSPSPQVSVGRSSSEPPVVFASETRPQLQTKHLRIGCFIFEGQDQIDFTGPFEVFSRIPNVSVEIVGKSLAPVRDVKGLILTPTTTIADGEVYDVLAVSGGLGQQELMDDASVISLIQRHDVPGSLIFSVCTGALLCGAAGILRGRKATTHWAALDLLPSYGADATRARVVVDRNYVSTAGVTAGLDGALLVASLLRGNSVAEEIQLDIKYAPEPLFYSGTPDVASADTVEAFFLVYGANNNPGRQKQPASRRSLASLRDKVPQRLKKLVHKPPAR